MYFFLFVAFSLQAKPEGDKALDKVGIRALNGAVHKTEENSNDIDKDIETISKNKNKIGANAKAGSGPENQEEIMKLFRSFEKKRKEDNLRKQNEAQDDGNELENSNKEMHKKFEEKEKNSFEGLKAMYNKHETNKHNRISSKKQKDDNDFLFDFDLDDEKKNKDDKKHKDDDFLFDFDLDKKNKNKDDKKHKDDDFFIDFDFDDEKKNKDDKKQKDDDFIGLGSDKKNKNKNDKKQKDDDFIGLDSDKKNKNKNDKRQKDDFLIDFDEKKQKEQSFDNSNNKESRNNDNKQKINDDVKIEEHNNDNKKKKIRVKQKNDQIYIIQKLNKFYLNNSISVKFSLRDSFEHKTGLCRFNSEVVVSSYLSNEQIICKIPDNIKFNFMISISLGKGWSQPIYFENGYEIDVMQIYSKTKSFLPFLLLCGASLVLFILIARCCRNIACFKSSKRIGFRSARLIPINESRNEEKFDVHFDPISDQDGNLPL